MLDHAQTVCRNAAPAGVRCPQAACPGRDAGWAITWREPTDLQNSTVESRAQVRKDAVEISTPHSQQRQPLREVSALAAGTHRTGSALLLPRRHTGDESQPRLGVRLDDVGGSAPRVPWALDTLHGAKGWHPHFDGASRGTLDELF